MTVSRSFMVMPAYFENIPAPLRRRVVATPGGHKRGKTDEPQNQAG